MTETYELGMVGLGVMGHNLVLNMSDHGFAVAGYDVSADSVREFNRQAGQRNIQAFEQLKDFIASLKTPRVVMMLVPAGVVDDAIQNILPFLEAGDILVDGGNSHFGDTDRRAALLESQGLRFLGVGISGGEAGARYGPSIMPGGPKDAYERIRPVFEAVAASVHQEPCVAYLGAGSAGHYVKMVHNGIEYGLMQLIAESYDLMKTALGMNNDEIGDCYARWNQSGLNSFLMEITAEIFKQREPQTGKRLLDLILDVARQKGTGIWTSEDAMRLHVPLPTIDMAVTMRDLSAFKQERELLSRQLIGPKQKTLPDRAAFLERLENALYASMILTYSQGMSLLRAASQHYGYRLNLSTIARIWRGGCIIRSALLDSVSEAYQNRPDLSTLMLDDYFAPEVTVRQDDLREVVITALQRGIPLPAFAATLGYYDACRRSWLPANLIQAQRDFFGAHHYERIDQAGSFHTEWGEPRKEQAYAHS